MIYDLKLPLTVGWKDKLEENDSKENHFGGSEEGDDVEVERSRNIWDMF